MRGNRGNFVADDAALAVRGGQGLLSGLRRYARCGHKLQVRYWGKSGTAARYLCAGDFETGGSYCIGFGCATVDKCFGELILEVISPRGLKARIAELARTGGESNARRTALERKLQQVCYEAERAFAQYDQADPNNRLVADVLEQRWNAKLEDQHRLERELYELSEATPALGDGDALAIRALGESFASVWNDAQVPDDAEEANRANSHRRGHGRPRRERPGAAHGRALAWRVSHCVQEARVRGRDNDPGSHRQSVIAHSHFAFH